MNNLHPCNCGTRQGGRLSRPTRRSRGAEIVGWIVSSATLALLPKCPICVAAYIALFTGLGISISTATYIRMSLLIVCLASLSFLLTRRVRHWFSSSMRQS